MIDEELPLKPLDQIKVWKPEPVREPILPSKITEHKAAKMNRPIHHNHHHGRHPKHHNHK